MKKRGQAAIEYLLVGSLVTLIIIPTLYVFYGYSQSSNEEIRQSQLNKVGTDIVNIAEQVYYLGEPSKVTIDAAMPSGIVGIEVWKNKELVFFLNDGSEVAFKSKVNITTNQLCIGRCFGNFTKKFYSPGLKSIIIEAKEDHVFIREVSDNQTDQAKKELIYCDNDEDTYYSTEGSYFCQPGRNSDTEPGDDCDDSDDEIYPGATEICNNKDDDCDGSIDEGFTNENCKYVCVANEYVWTNNGDPLNCCGNDANEGNPYEEIETLCDGSDNDCDGFIDNGLTAPLCAKQDGVCAGSTKPCGGADGWLDCDDAVYLAWNSSYENTEVTCYDSQDNDCDTLIDCDDENDCENKICNVEGTKKCIYNVYTYGLECTLI